LSQSGTSGTRAAPRALFDVNVLIALLDASHVHHAPATAWLQANGAHGWASCPQALAAGQVAAQLARAASHPQHAFWPDDLSLLEPGAMNWNSILGSRQVTDAYLLALAVRRGGRLVTLDRGVALPAVAGATPEHLVLL
jgi:predicted nucleic acid-binding protein